ncbi:MAG: DNA primase [Verrucomicrobiae bacterium]|nr:DNA primase [Verrucomicrobiae bacterium]
MGGWIADELLEQIRQANDIVEVINGYVPLKRAGANYRALCPFHKEKTPSFHVHPQRQIWHCFGCGRGGDVFRFLMEYENLDFVTAVRRLADRVGIVVESSRDPRAGATAELKERLWKLHEQVTAWFQENLQQTAAARAYLTGRGLTESAIQRWQIGYAPDSWDALRSWAEKKKIPVELLEQAGLLVRNEKGHLYDRFRGRVMFPIRDEQGRVVAFSGRILTDDKEQAKYVNSPETPIFQKSRILFAYDRAKRPMLEAGFAVVCEGQIDALTCHEAGLENVVAPQGTALTEQHARLLKRFVNEVVLLFDGDEAGQNAVVRSADALMEAGLAIRVALLPAEHDPDSFLRTHGVEALRALIRDAPSFFQHHLHRLAQRYDLATERGKMEVAAQMLEWVEKTPNAVVQASYLQQLARRLGVPEDALRSELRKRQRGTISPIAREANASSADDSPAAERMLLQMALQDARVLDVACRTGCESWLSDSRAGRLLRTALALYQQGRWDGPRRLFDDHTTEADAHFLSRILMEPLPAAERFEQAVGDCLSHLQRRAVERKIQAVKMRLTEPGLSSEETLALQAQVLDLRRKLTHIAPLLVWKVTKS